MRSPSPREEPGFEGVNEFGFVDLDRIQFDVSVLRLVPGDLARSHRVLPVAIQNGRLLLAMTDVNEWRAQDVIRKATNMPVLPLRVEPQQFDRYFGLLIGSHR